MKQNGLPGVLDIGVAEPMGMHMGYDRRPWRLGEPLRAALASRFLARPTERRREW